MYNFLPDIPERRSLSGQRRKSDRNVCVSAWRRRTIVNPISVSVTVAIQSLSASWHMVRYYVPKRTKLGYPPEGPIVSITRKKVASDLTLLRRPSMPSCRLQEMWDSGRPARCWGRSCSDCWTTSPSPLTPSWHCFQDRLSILFCHSIHSDRACQRERMIG